MHIATRLRGSPASRYLVACMGVQDSGGYQHASPPLHNADKLESPCVFHLRSSVRDSTGRRRLFCPTCFLYTPELFSFCLLYVFSIFPKDPAQVFREKPITAKGTLMADDTATYNAEYNGAGLVITSAIFLGLTYLSVGLRTYVRAYLTKCFQLDDWLMLVAQVCLIKNVQKRYGTLTLWSSGNFHRLMLFYISRCTGWHGSS